MGNWSNIEIFKTKAIHINPKYSYSTYMRSLSKKTPTCFGSTPQYLFLLKIPVPLLTEMLHCKCYLFWRAKTFLSHWINSLHQKNVHPYSKHLNLYSFKRGLLLNFQSTKIGNIDSETINITNSHIVFLYNNLLYTTSKSKNFVISKKEIVTDITTYKHSLWK